MFLSLPLDQLALAPLRLHFKIAQGTNRLSCETAAPPAAAHPDACACGCFNVHVEATHDAHGLTVSISALRDPGRIPVKLAGHHHVRSVSGNGASDWGSPRGSPSGYEAEHEHDMDAAMSPSESPAVSPATLANRSDPVGALCAALPNASAGWFQSLIQTAAQPAFAIDPALNTPGPSSHAIDPPAPGKRAHRLPCTHPGCPRAFTSDYTRRVHLRTHAPKPPKSKFPCRGAGGVPHLYDTDPNPNINGGSGATGGEGGRGGRGGEGEGEGDGGAGGCGEVFLRQHDRLRHEVVQHGRKCEHVCAACGGFFASAATMGRHVCRGEGRARWRVPDQEGEREEN